MPLAGSGEISIGGSTANRSINLELGRAQNANTSLLETAVRNLAGKPTGAVVLPNDFWGKSAYTPPSLSKSGDVYGECFFFNIGGSCTASTGSVTCTVSGGQGPYSYAWAYISGTAAAVGSPSSNTTTFSRSLGNGLYNGTYRCTVTDALSNTAFVDVNVQTFHYREF